MSDNSVLPATGENIRLIDRSGSGPKTQVMSIDIGSAGAGNEVILRGVTSIPDNQAPAIPTRMVGQDIWNCSFSDVGASVIAAEFEQTPVVGTGVGYSQASGNLAITTGTTTNAEFLAKSIQSWRGALRLRFGFVASQRIANQNFAVILGDLIGQALAITINSATSISVTKTAHGLTAKNVGQFMFVGGIVGAAGVPGRYAIASITDANTFVLTVAGWPASGSCTATLFGHSHVKTLFTGVTATNAAWDTQRRGWAAGDTTLTINTTASPGTVIQNEIDGRCAYASDTLRASTATPNVTTRGSRVENLPDDNLDLYVFLWSYNGTVAPASTTTWTMSFITVEKFANIPVYVQGQRAQGSQNPAPVAVQGTAAVSLATNTPTLAAGTNLAGDVGIQYRANATGAATISKFTSAASTNGALLLTGARRLLGWALVNTSASVKYFKFYNKATAPTVGTDATAFVVAVPAGGTAVFQMPGGMAISLGLGIACTGGAADADVTATAANDVVGAVFYV